MQHGFALGLLAFALQLALDFHFKIPALALAFATIAALAVGLNWPLPAADAPATHRATGMRRFAGGAAAALLAVAAAGWLPTHYRAEAIRYDLRRQLDTLAKPTTTPAEKQAVASRAHNEIGRVVQLSPANAQAWADRAYAAAIVARYAPESQVELGRAAEVDARRALALGQVVPEFWVRLGVALDMQQRWLEAGDAFSEALRLAPFSGRIWFHHAYHLALNPVAIPLARAAVATCLRLDPGNVEGESLQRNLSARP